VRGVLAKDKSMGQGNLQEATTSDFLKSLRRIVSLIKKEFIQIRRNRQNFAILLVAPLIQLLIFGHASRLDVQDVTMVIADMDRSATSRDIIQAFSQSGYFKIVKIIPSYDDADKYLDSEQASMAILIPPDLERLVKSGNTARVGVLIDGVNTTTAGTVSGYAQSIIEQVSKDLLNKRINRMQGLLYETETPRLIVPLINDSTRAWFNPNLNSKDFFVPGVLVLILLALTTILTSAVIVREKEVGTIEQLMVTPITRLELILGKIIPCFLIEIVTLVTIMPLAFAIYDIPFRGSFVFFLGTCLIFLVAISGVGMTISAFCKTQQQAVLSSFMFMQPAVLLSGYAFPIENMPKVVQYVTYLNPLRYFITIVRGVFLKGVGWDILWPQVVPLAFMAVFYVGWASALFKKRTD
jgi:ABC-2 type transport system permease protein